MPRAPPSPAPQSAGWRFRSVLRCVFSRPISGDDETLVLKKLGCHKKRVAVELSSEEIHDTAVRASILSCSRIRRAHHFHRESLGDVALLAAPERVRAEVEFL